MDNYEKKNEMRTNLLPVIPLRGKVAFPHVATGFDVGREMTVKAIERAGENGDKLVFICTQKDVDQDEVGASDLYAVGTVSKIKQISRQPSGNIRVLTEGLYRARVRVIQQKDGCFQAVVDEITTRRSDEVLVQAYLRTADALIVDVLGEGGKISKETAQRLETITDAEQYVDTATAAMRVRVDIKQKILEEERLLERLKLLERCLNDELEISRVERKISTKVRQSIDKSQKEYYLREQLKAIHEELGDEGEEAEQYREKLRAKSLPESVLDKCLKEVDRMQKMPSSAPEYTVIAGYLDQVLELPWTEETTDTESLADCIAVLDADHYGLEKIKERITEYLAVLKLTKSLKAPILCFVGPPGVGKTSIARSVARALDRKFVRMSLGGVKDEAEIRGHRRTYIGSMPGRILYAMKTAGSINPVILLDEIDKVSSDMRGDPASALLEVLDPEQNATFRDRFLEVSYDLSKILFITTANTLDTIPAPLRDRMEIIEVSGYTMEEKTEIAKNYLVPKQRNANGLAENKIAFTDDGIRAVVEGYTMEAGVRNLEREIGTICRKVAVKYADNKRMRKVTVDEKKVKELLGVAKYEKDDKLSAPQVGAVNGLAWTAFGGTTLTVEATAYKGKGEIKLTGKLGDVMKESAHAAITYLRANAHKYGIDEEKFTSTDIHVHVPEGATPKDGPSAGITIATAILSVYKEQPVRADVAMTGEITLRGKVLPIGGLKEKALAARRLGIKEIVIPKANEKDLQKLPKDALDELHFIPVESVDEVFKIALKQ